MSEYESAPGYLFYEGKRFFCSCGDNEFKVEIGTDPVIFWCACGSAYTEDLVNTMMKESEEVVGG